MPFLKIPIAIKKFTTVALNKLIPSFIFLLSSFSFNITLLFPSLNNFLIFSDWRKLYLSWNKVRGGINIF